MPPILELSRVSKRFRGLAALQNLDFQVGKGEILGLVGPNGAGKTTIFNLITGMFPASSGRIAFRGKDVTNLKSYQINRMGIARTFQVVRPFAKLTLAENAMVGPLARGASIAAARKLARETLEMVGLGRRATDLAISLTLSDRKKLELARALCTEPSLLLLDEVMGGLNTTEANDMVEIIRGIHAKGVTLVVIEHLMSVILKLSHRVVVLHHGEKLAEGLPAETLRDPRVVNAYLGEDDLGA